MWALPDLPTPPSDGLSRAIQQNTRVGSIRVFCCSPRSGRTKHEPSPRCQRAHTGGVTGDTARRFRTLQDRCAGRCGRSWALLACLRPRIPIGEPPCTITPNPPKSSTPGWPNGNARSPPIDRTSRQRVCSPEMGSGRRLCRHRRSSRACGTCSARQRACTSNPAAEGTGPNLCRSRQASRHAYDGTGQGAPLPWIHRMRDLPHTEPANKRSTEGRPSDVPEPSDPATARPRARSGKSRDLAKPASAATDRIGTRFRRAAAEAACQQSSIATAGPRRFLTRPAASAIEQAPAEIANYSGRLFPQTPRAVSEFRNRPRLCSD